MLAVLKNTFITFAKNGEIILLLVILMAAPVFVDLNPSLYFYVTGFFTIAAQLILFIYLLRPNAFYKLKSPCFILKFTLFYLGISFVYIVAMDYLRGVTVLLYLKSHLSFIANSNLSYFLFVFTPSFMIASYFAMRLYVIIPMIIMDDKLSLKNIYNRSKGSNALWLIAPLIFIAPLRPLYVVIGEGEVFTILYNLFSLLLCCFYSCYYQSKKMS